MSDIPVSCDTDKPAKLIRSMSGGSLLVYQCADCGAELLRTMDQAERDAVIKNSRLVMKVLSHDCDESCG